MRDKEVQMTEKARGGKLNQKKKKKRGKRVNTRESKRPLKIENCLRSLKGTEGLILKPLRSCVAFMSYAENHTTLLLVLHGHTDHNVKFGYGKELHPHRGQTHDH